ncbi:MAG: V-type ATP synthase subunit A [Synergistaceae bacterium]|jgi:V/A-type H+-transporting ATPase subunit A|nr:V-type ATP synthase subunit A [Synergistaceae bacterium]
MKGFVSRVSGSVVTVRTGAPVRLFEAARVGLAGFPGETAGLRGFWGPDSAPEVDVVLCENPSGLSVDEEVSFTGGPLSVELGPGLLGDVVDGLGRSLRGDGFYLGEGGGDSLPQNRTWRFTPSAAVGDTALPGGFLGAAAEGSCFVHRVLVPCDVPRAAKGNTVAWIAPEGDYAAWDCICRLADGTEFSLSRRWAIRVPRPFAARLPLDRPFYTGVRGLDALLPLAEGGVAILPGGPGTGKTVLQQSLARHCRADVVVCVNCGGRGNETAELFEDFSSIPAPGGGSLMERTLLVSAPADAPPAMRETAVCLAMTAAEFYRDMGYSAVVLVDSVSRWEEASREVEAHLSGPGGAFYARLARHCQRAGAVETLEGRRGAVTLVNAASPRDGDFSDPVTQAALRLSGAFWGLNGEWARARCFPALDWERNWSLYGDALSGVLTRETGEDWAKSRDYLLSFLSQAGELSGPARLQTLSDQERWLLYHSETLQDLYLRQNATDLSGGLSSALLRFLKALDSKVQEAGFPDEAFTVRPELARLFTLPEEEFPDRAREWLEHFAGALTPAVGNF